MAADEYLNFDLAIETEAGGYLASVRASPGGDATEPFDLPFTAEGLENLVLKLGRSRTVVRRVGSSHDQLAERFGRELYTAVLSGTVGFAYHDSLQAAERQGKGLRLRLNLDRATELADVPWELLYSPTLHRPLALSTRTPVVRYIGLPFAAKPLSVAAPLRVLVVVAAPTDLVDLDTGAEVARIRDATEDLARAGLVRIDQLEHASLLDLVRYLETSECHVLHFVGHGGYEEQGDSGSGVLAFENGDRRHQLVTGDRLGVLLDDHLPLRLAVLNACEGARTSPTDPFAGVAQSLVRQGIPAVVAMQFEVTDTAAIVFGHELYRALGTGAPIDKATAIARRAMLAGNHDVEWATPVLYLRSTSGHLFDVHGVEDAQTEPIDTELVKRYAEATAAHERWATTGIRDDLEQAVSLLEEVARRSPDFRRSVEQLTDARAALAEVLYREAAASITRGRRLDGLALLDRVDELDPLRGDPDELRRRARTDEGVPPRPPGDGGESGPNGTVPPSEPETEDEPEVVPPPAPTPPGEPSAGRPRRWRKPVFAVAGLALVAGLASLLLDGGRVDEDEVEEDGAADAEPDPTPLAEFVATRVESASIDDDAWAENLERYPTTYRAEGEDDPQVSSEWALAWNADHLYLVVDVIDDDVATPRANEPNLLYQGDGVNFYFGRPPENLERDAPLRGGDVQIMIGPANSDADDAVAGMQVPERDGPTCHGDDAPVFAGGGTAPSIEATSWRTDDGYRLAAAVPWGLLGHGPGEAPDEGDVFGTILSVSDVDPSTGERRGSRSSHDDRESAKHCPARWQTLVLGPG